MDVDQPVPMPSAPLMSTVGMIGMYLQTGAQNVIPYVHSASHCKQTTMKSCGLSSICKLRRVWPYRIVHTNTQNSPEWLNALPLFIKVIEQPVVSFVE